MASVNPPLEAQWKNAVRHRALPRPGLVPRIAHQRSKGTHIVFSLVAPLYLK